MKKIIAIALALVMCFGCFVACGKTESPAPAEVAAPAEVPAEVPAEAPVEEAVDPALEETYALTMGSTMTSSALITPLIANACKNIEEKTNGHVIIDFFPDSTLGNDSEMYSQMQNGELDFLNTGIMAKVMINDYAFLTGYWWMKDMDHFWAVWNSEIGERYQAVMENDYNTHQVCATLLGRHNLISTQPIKTLEDFNGLQLRISSNPAAVQLWAAIGVNVNIMPWGEVVPSLQTGVINTVGHTYQQFYDTGLQELGSYLTETNHEADITCIYACNDTWNNLPEEYRDVIQAEFEACFAEFDAMRDESMENARQAMVDAGLEYTKLDDEVRAKIVETMEPVLREIFETTWTGATYDEVMSYAK